jgi:hypothetical protein
MNHEDMAVAFLLVWVAFVIILLERDKRNARRMRDQAIERLKDR